MPIVLPKNQLNKTKPDQVIKARNFFRVNYPSMYTRLAGYENSCNIGNLDTFQTHCFLHSYDFEMLKPFILDFINCKEGDKEPELKRKKLKS